MLRQGLALAFLAAALVFYRYGALWEGAASCLAALLVVLPELREGRRREFYAQKTTDRGLQKLAELEEALRAQEGGL